MIVRRRNCLQSVIGRLCCTDEEIVELRTQISRYEMKVRKLENDQQRDMDNTEDDSVKNELDLARQRLGSTSPLHFICIAYCVG